MTQGDLATLKGAFDVLRSVARSRGGNLKASLDGTEARALWQLLVKMRRGGMPHDVVAVMDELLQADHLDWLLRELLDRGPTGVITSEMAAAASALEKANRKE